MKQIIFSLGEQVEFGGVGLILDKPNNQITENSDSRKQTYEAKSYYRKLHNVFSTFVHKGFIKNMC